MYQSTCFGAENHEKFLLSCQNPLIFRLILVVLLAGVRLNANADFDEGVAAYERGDYATALREWRPLAEQGHANARFKLGLMYTKRQGMPQDYEVAAQWYRRVGEQDVNVQCMLGFFYQMGINLQRDYKTAVQWYRRAAERGHYEAQYRLGLLYSLGKGVPQDYKTAVQ